MPRIWNALTKISIAAAIIILSLVGPAFTAEPAQTTLEEIATSTRELKDALGMFLVLFLWLMLGVGTAAVSLLGRASFVRLANHLDALTQDVTALKSSFIGGLNFVILLLLALGLTNLDPSGILSVIILIFVAIMIYVGLLGTTVTLGEKVLALRADELSEFTKVIAGNAALFTAALVPILGWAFFLYVIIRSFGLALIWMVRRKKLA